MWEKISKVVHSHVIISTISLSAIFMGLLVMLAITFMNSVAGMPPEPSDLALFTLGQMALSAITIFLMVKLNVFSKDDLKSKKIGRGLILGWVTYVIVIVTVVVNVSSFPANSFAIPNAPSLVITILHPFIGTGLFEEVLFRGLVLNLLLVEFGGSKKGIVKAVIISSVLFGVVHIGNAIAGVGLLATITTIIGATLVGVFYAALYMRTKNLWVVIILHAITNLSRQIFNAIVSRDVFMEPMVMQMQTEPSLLDCLISLAGPIVCVIAGIVLLRKVKPDEIIDEIS